MEQADFTIADVLAWARTKPANEAYSYYDANNCALSQFLRETGRAERPVVSPGCWWDGENGDRQLYSQAISDAANLGPDTFGNFAKNLADIEGVSA